MSNMNRRLKKVEKALNVDKEQRIAEVVWFADGPLPPDDIQGNRTIRHVRYDDICKATKSNQKQPIQEKLG
jgi:hypothetical protein